MNDSIFPKLEWTEINNPDDFCHYHYVRAHTPFGEFLITWKGWKNYPEYAIDETPWGEFWESASTLERAKEMAEQEYCKRLKLCLDLEENTK